MYALAYKDMQGWPTLLKDPDGRMYTYSTSAIAEEAADSLRDAIIDAVNNRQVHRVPIFFGLLTKEVDVSLGFDDVYELDRIHTTLYVHSYQTSMYHMNHKELKLHA